MKNKRYIFLLLPLALISEMYNYVCAINNYKNTYNPIKHKALLFYPTFTANNLSITFFVSYIMIRQSACVWEVLTYIAG
ncbi:MAG TPA: hypothetical protein PLF32_09530 [Bacteroidales bacterium]|nr:hypothetical protein [Bacteroidales bacterium]HOR82879.1 hypothetical protein [Bacteroidales bacterium]HPJ91819.1 hypothetical protein [Bacteroidales bacterium]